MHGHVVECVELQEVEISVHSRDVRKEEGSLSVKTLHASLNSYHGPGNREREKKLYREHYTQNKGEKAIFKKKILSTRSTGK